MEHVKLAVCIPTYNRPDVIKEFIEKYAMMYIKYNFSIYIYDSSEDKKTESIVKEWQQHYTRLNYVQVAPETHSNMKVYNIFRKFEGSLEYDYLWVCSDSIRWTQKVLDSINNAAKQGYDIIIPNYRDVEKIGNKVYKDANELFLDCAWHMTLYGAVVLKISTMLREVNWKMLIEKYAVPECINHSHVAFYFERLSSMHDWRALHLSFLEQDLIASSLKKFPGWQKETFYVWCHCWPSMINRLPGVYKNKRRVIKKSGVNSGILTYSNFVSLRAEEILDIDIYRCYRKKWHQLTNVPRIVIWIISVFPISTVIYMRNGKTVWLYIKHLLLRKRLKKKLKKYCTKFDKIFIYGAGKKASGYTKYLNEMNIKFEAYLVSEVLDNNIKIIDGHKVIPFCPNLIKDEKIGIILALNEKNTKEVLVQILSGVDRKRLFSDIKGCFDSTR